MAPAAKPDNLFILRAAGCCLVVDCRGGDLPVIAHWGRDLGDVSGADLATLVHGIEPAVPSNSLDRPHPVGILPQHATGYAGRATLEGSRAIGDWSVMFREPVSTLRTDGEGTQHLTIRAADDAGSLGLCTELRLGAAGTVMLRHTVTNLVVEPFSVRHLPAVLPVPARATELLDFTGRHLRERSPQRLELPFGAWVREQRRGRTGHDAPLVLAVGAPGFSWQAGEVWAVHVGWSGDSATFAERLPEGWSAVGGGELLQPTEVTLAAGESYAGPWVYAAYSAAGLDGISAAYHEMLRQRPTHPASFRPVLLNTWEAVYFDHDLDRLRSLADCAATVGVERFVLDDGWFGGRRDDTAGLGDWTVSEQVWPGGLAPLVDHVVGLGMQFGLWVEPEMVNRDSDLARAHPDWLMGLASRTPPTARHQDVLDVARPDTYRHLLERMDALLSEYAISYLKWDHNRDLVDATHDEGSRRGPGVHAQTLAVYRLLDELRGLHPSVEIECCAGGGGRVDLGMLQRTDRVWVSDCNDPLERQQIQRWTNLLVPYELLGCHIGPPRAPTTGRVSDLSFRAGTALFGHLGIEWDLTTASADDLEQLTGWVTLHKELRGLLHSGRVVRADLADDGSLVHGVVATDRREAVFAHVQVATPVGSRAAPIRLPGLDPRQRYRVVVLRLEPRPRTVGVREPPWWIHGEITLPGNILGEVGLAPPMLAPEQVILLRAAAC